MSWSATLKEHSLLRKTASHHRDISTPRQGQDGHQGPPSDARCRPRLPVSERHLRELCPPCLVQTAGSTDSSASPSIPLKESISIKPLSLWDHVKEGLALFGRNLRHPHLIPGTSLWEKVYAMGLLPVMMVILVGCQWVIGIVIYWSTHTRLGKYAYGRFLKDQILLYDPTDTINPRGNDEAVRLLGSHRTKGAPSFEYHIANLLLILSTLTYDRDNALVQQAAAILEDMESEEQKQKAAELLQESTRLIDEKSFRHFDLRFAGISELKTLGGPFAGLFYNDHSIVLTFKGTSVLAFNEYVIDAKVQRVDAREYLYGEIHKGFYESLFPDPVPLDEFERQHFDRTNPFETIMETIFDVAKEAKQRTGKAVNLWFTGHSLGGGLASMTMARLQKPLCPGDPLLNGQLSLAQNISPLQSWTVLDEMLARYSHDMDLIVLRDCYSFASPKLGDSGFAQEFDRNQAQYLSQSRFKPVHYRVITEKDVIPKMPPSCSTDPGDTRKRLYPCPDCPKVAVDEAMERPTLAGHAQHDSDQTLYYHSSDDSYASSVVRKDASPKEALLPKPPHLNSLLDYKHIGQLVRLYNKPSRPTIAPTALQTNLCDNVLRNQDELLEALNELERLALLSDTTTTTETSSLTTVAVSDNYGTFNGSSNTSPSPQHQRRQTPLASPPKVPSSPPSLFSAQKTARELGQAQTKYHLDEMSRLRKPCDTEKFLLLFPNVISHSPAAYQRNLVQARFYFRSYPGEAFGPQVATTFGDECRVVEAGEEEEEEYEVYEEEGEEDGELEREVDLVHSMGRRQQLRGALSAGKKVLKEWSYHSVGKKVSKKWAHHYRSSSAVILPISITTTSREE